MPRRIRSKIKWWDITINTQKSITLILSLLHSRVFVFALFCQFTCLVRYFRYFLPHKHVNELISNGRRMKLNENEMNKCETSALLKYSPVEKNSHRIIFWLQLIISSPSKAFFGVWNLLALFVWLLFDLLWMGNLLLDTTWKKSQIVDFPLK